MSFARFFVGLFIVLSINSMALADCNSYCTTKAGFEKWESVCATNNNTTVIHVDGMGDVSIAEYGCRNATTFGCKWVDGGKEVVKCSGGPDQAMKSVCKQQNNLPVEIVELACDNLQVVSGCSYGPTCE